MLSTAAARSARRRLATWTSRQFIWDSLYDAKFGYFATRTVVGHTPSPIVFRELLGQADWARAVDALYATGGRAGASAPDVWFTPVELFRPYYSWALAHYVLRMYHEASRPASGAGAAPRLRIFEVGAGNGTNAAHLCDRLRATAPAVYKHLQYWTIEVAEPLAAVQRATLRAAGHAQHHRVLVKDAACLEPADVADDRSTSHSTHSSRTVDVVLLTEVLDNLPHDRVILELSDSAAYWERFDRAADALLRNAAAAPAAIPALAQQLVSSALVASVLADDDDDDDNDNDARWWRSEVAAMLQPWGLIRVSDQGPHAGAAFTESVVPALSDPRTCQAIAAFVLAPIIAERAIARRKPDQESDEPRRQITRAGETAPRGLVARAIRQVAHAVLRGRDMLQQVLYASAERESQAGPWRALGEQWGAHQGSASAALSLVSGSSTSQLPGTNMRNNSRGSGSRVGDAQSLPAVRLPAELGDSPRALGCPTPAPLAIGHALSTLALSYGASAVRASAFVPTQAVTLMSALHRALPGHGLIAADFHALPEPAVATSSTTGDADDSTKLDDDVQPGALDLPRAWVRSSAATPWESDVVVVAAGPSVNCPLVQSRDPAAARPAAGFREHRSYLTPAPRGTADIFFATDFAALGSYWLALGSGSTTVTPRAVHVALQAHVLDAAGVVDHGRTLSGFNPMLDEFGNASIMLGWPAPVRARGV